MQLGRALEEVTSFVATGFTDVEAGAETSAEEATLLGVPEVDLVGKSCTDCDALIELATTRWLKCTVLLVDFENVLSKTKA